MDDKYFGFTKEDWERLQMEHREWQESLEGLTFVPLWPDGTPGYVPEYGQEEPKLCLLPPQKEKRGCVLVCAGGGYGMKSVFEGRTRGGDRKTCERAELYGVRQRSHERLENRQHI